MLYSMEFLLIRGGGFLGREMRFLSKAQMNKGQGPVLYRCIRGCFKYVCG